VVFTRSGAGARHVSKCRPRTPILAATPLVGTARRLQLLHGASTALVEAGSDPEALFGNLEATILANHHARHGDRVVLVFGLPMGTPGNTNAIRVHEVGSTR
jgi:pyruvate kinase